MSECRVYKRPMYNKGILHLKRVERLIRLRERFDLELEDERLEFLHHLDTCFVRDWQGLVPNHRDVFPRAEIIESLIADAMKSNDSRLLDGQQIARLIRFFADTGYRIEPELGEDGLSPRLRRATPIHRAARCGRRDLQLYLILPDLFRIYRWIDYVDDSGLTHFHAACLAGCAEACERFLAAAEGRADPNRVWEETGDSPLHLVMRKTSDRTTVKLLLEAGADPSAVNKAGQTPLHVVSLDFCAPGDLAMMCLESCSEKTAASLVDARDELGNTALSLALRHGNAHMAESLLRSGADPNLANEEGSTPLHVTCENRRRGADLARILFEVSAVQLDVPDKLGRTPLRLAVANVSPRMVAALLARGADLAGFRFPTEADLDGFVEIEQCRDHHSKYALLSGLLACLEHLETRGRQYELYQSDALIVAKYIAKYELLTCWGLEPRDQNWYENEEFASVAKEIQVKADVLSLYDLMRLRPREAEKLCTCADYFEFSDSRRLSWCSIPWNSRGACYRRLCEATSWRFFRDWALDPFVKLTHRRLPILCCEMIVDNLTSQDLLNVFLAAFGHGS